MIKKLVGANHPCLNGSQCETQWVPHFWPVLPEVGILTSPKSPTTLVIPRSKATRYPLSHHPLRTQPPPHCKNNWVPHFWPVLPEVGILTSPKSPTTLVIPRSKATRYPLSHHPLRTQPPSHCKNNWVPHFWPVLPEVGISTSPKSPTTLVIPRSKATRYPLSHHPLRTQPPPHCKNNWVPHFWPVLPEVGISTSPKSPTTLVIPRSKATRYPL